MSNVLLFGLFTPMRRLHLLRRARAAEPIVDTAPAKPYHSDDPGLQAHIAKLVTETRNHFATYPDCRECESRLCWPCAKAEVESLKNSISELIEIHRSYSHPPLIYTVDAKHENGKAHITIAFTRSAKEVT